jgi:hypothetical protein
MKLTKCLINSISFLRPIKVSRAKAFFKPLKMNLILPLFIYKVAPIKKVNSKQAIVLILSNLKFDFFFFLKNSKLILYPIINAFFI